MNNQKCENCLWSIRYETGDVLRCKWTKRHSVPYILEETFPIVEPTWGRKCKVWEMKSDTENE